MAMNTDLIKVSQHIESALSECSMQSIAKLPKFARAIKMAEGIAALRQALTDQFVTQTLMPLQGTALGFLTDQDTKGGYGLSVVRECAIEAMLRGFNVVGNEFNIISGRFYGAKAGFERLVNECSGIRFLDMRPGVPTLVGDKGALVPFEATWEFEGRKDAIECLQTPKGDFRIPVRVNSGMGTDAIVGKATRKMYARIYSRLNGGTYGLSDGEVGDEPLVTTGEGAPPPVPEGTPEGRRVKLGGKKDKVEVPAEAKAEPKPETKAAEQTPPKRKRGEPAGDVPISQPTAPSWAALHEALAEADKGWIGDDRLPTIMAWSPEWQRSAYAWALAFNDGTIDDDKLPPRPPWTVLDRQPGEDG